MRGDVILEWERGYGSMLSHFVPVRRTMNMLLGEPTERPAFYLGRLQRSLELKRERKPSTPWTLQWAGVGSRKEVLELSLEEIKSLYTSLCAVKDAEWRAQGGEGESLGFLV